MKKFNWSEEKNEWLKRERNISFDDMIFLIAEDRLIAKAKHPNSEKYPNQEIFYVDVYGYIYLVPFVEKPNEIFLKTIIPSRKATKQYLKEDAE